MSVTTVFTNGGSQAVRIPKDFRFATDRVTVEAFRGGLLLMPVCAKPTLREVFAACDELTASEKTFLSERSGNGLAQHRELFA